MKKILFLACLCAVFATGQPGQPVVTITTSSLPGGTLGVFYFAQLTDSVIGGEGTGKDTWSVQGLPPGLACSPSGVISGTPTSNGFYPFNVTVINDPNGFASKQLSILIVDKVTLNPATLPDGFPGKPYSYTFTAGGGSGLYSYSGDGLPDGLNMGLDGVLSGTPTADSSGTYNITVSVTDSQSGSMASAQFPLVIVGPPRITTLTLPDSTVSASYSQTVQITGGVAPLSFSVVSSASSALPPGLTLSKTGTLSGIPTSAGNFNFTITVTDNVKASASQTYKLTVNALPSITNSSPLPPGTLGGSYNVTLQVTGGTPPFTFSNTGSLPLGISLGRTGTLTGTPVSNGTFVFNAIATDATGVAANKQFQITVAPPGQLLIITSTQLDFTGPAGGDAPPSQHIGIVSSNGGAVSFAVQADGGAATTPAPGWLSIHLSRGVTPAVLVVSVDQTGLTAGPYSARVTFSVPGDPAQTPLVAKITFTVVNLPPNLELSGLLRFAALASTPATLEQSIVVRNSGGGTLSFGAAVLNRSTWIDSVTPAVGQTAPNQPQSATVRVKTLGLKAGSYRDAIRFTWSGGSLDVPVSLFVSDQGPILSLDVTGLRFALRQGNGSGGSRTVRVLNHGEAGSTVRWKAEILNGQDWLVLGTSQGTATATTPGTLALTVGPGGAALAPGGHYALVRFTDPNALNSPQYAMAVLDVAPASASATPELSAPPLVFSAPLKSTGKLNGTVTVGVSSTTPVAFQATAQTDDGGNWLQVDPPSGFASTASPGKITGNLDPSSLAVGVHKAQINVSISGNLRTTDVTLIVVPGGTPTAALRSATGCAPSGLALTLSGLSNSFSTPAGWPATLVAQLSDDCANPVNNGAIVASFSNGDSPISLVGDALTGSYSATWQPGRNASPMTVTLRASAGTLTKATAQIGGSVTANAAPVLAPGGTLHNLNPVVGAALAPGTVSQVFGSGLATGTASPGVVPLANTFGGTNMIVGGLDAPLYYLSDHQLVVQIPNELTPNRQYAAIVSINGALTLPDTIDITPIQPGVAAFLDGGIIAQHGIDFSLVDAAHPAHPGEALVMYLAGLGATNPPVPSGKPAPLTSLTPAVVQPTVTVDGQNAPVIFAGLTPGGIGLFQINFTVPQGARTGSLNVVVTQGGVTANTTMLPVKP